MKVKDIWFPACQPSPPTERERGERGKRTKSSRRETKMTFKTLLRVVASIETAIVPFATARAESVSARRAGYQTKRFHSPRAKKKRLLSLNGKGGGRGKTNKQWG